MFIPIQRFVVTRIGSHGRSTSQPPSSRIPLSHRPTTTSQNRSNRPAIAIPVAAKFQTLIPITTSGHRSSTNAEFHEPLTIIAGPRYRTAAAARVRPSATRSTRDNRFHRQAFQNSGGPIRTPKLGQTNVVFEHSRSAHNTDHRSEKWRSRRIPSSALQLNERMESSRTTRAFFFSIQNPDV